jgi:tRNA (mo5U34)-methyltransferase
MGARTSGVVARCLSRVPLLRSALRALRRLPRHFMPLRPDFGAEYRVEAPALAALADAELGRLNRALDWQCFVLDTHGRRFGNIAHAGKRTRPELIPDPRIALLDQRFPLAGAHVIEFGCFEGIHTAALCRLAARVTAIDARVDNVVKTMVRCGMLGCRPEVLRCDLEQPAELAGLPEADLIHHVGVLYHLADPVRHLLGLHRFARTGLMLDTHVAEKHELDDVLRVDGVEYPCMRYGEGGYADPFSGMREHASWLTLETICSLLERAGFDCIDVAQRRQERNGSRVLLFARRSAHAGADTP